MTPLIGLIIETVEESLEEWEKAAQEQREFQEWTVSIATQLTQPQRTEASNRYELWKNSMELLKSYVRQTVEGVNQQTIGIARAFLKDFGIIEFEKYLTLSQGISAKRTWFFRIDIRREDRSARYLFFCGFPSQALASRGVDVTLHLAREEPPDSFTYVHLSDIGGPDVPNLVELGYLADKEKLLLKGVDGSTMESSMDDMVRDLFQSIVQLQSPPNR